MTGLSEGWTREELYRLLATRHERADLGLPLSLFLTHLGNEDYSLTDAAVLTVRDPRAPTPPEEIIKQAVAAAEAERAWG